MGLAGIGEWLHRDEDIEGAAAPGPRVPSNARQTGRRGSLRRWPRIGLVGGSPAAASRGRRGFGPAVVARASRGRRAGPGAAQRHFQGESSSRPGGAVVRLERAAEKSFERADPEPVHPLRWHRVRPAGRPIAAALSCRTDRPRGQTVDAAEPAVLATLLAESAAYRRARSHGQTPVFNNVAAAGTTAHDALELFGSGADRPDGPFGPFVLRRLSTGAPHRGWTGEAGHEGRELSVVIRRSAGPSLGSGWHPVGAQEEQAQPRWLASTTGAWAGRSMVSGPPRGA